MRTLPWILMAMSLTACTPRAREAAVPAPSSTAPRAIAVYRTIAESIYVRSTGRVVAVATASLDSTCSAPRCAGLADRCGEADPGDVPPPEADGQEWSRFRATHADAAGAVRMSPVGFSRSGRTAVAFVDWRCGPTCGHTAGVALTATSDTSWAIADVLLVSSRQKP